ncbi:hypothetical protein [Burkholderia vietnamiensis]|nr:hypothetical protein [Burkholderia vietnamiensis]MBR8000507.1 hypothetical protein [Burkholderia vietnamiensis]
MTSPALPARAVCAPAVPKVKSHVRPLMPTARPADPSLITPTTMLRHAEH